MTSCWVARDPGEDKPILTALEKVAQKLGITKAAAVKVVKIEGSESTAEKAKEFLKDLAKASKTSCALASDYLSANKFTTDSPSWLRPPSLAWDKELYVSTFDSPTPALTELRASLAYRLEHPGSTFTPAQNNALNQLISVTSHAC
jgi:hypothetical protein